MKIKRTKQEFITHAFEPIYDENSKILILGTMPSPKSRENGFYYTHPQNRFWKAIACITNEPLPHNNEERKELLKKHGIALWDVLASCEIEGANDASIKKPVVNDIGIILRAAPIKAVFTTGKKATDIYNKYIFDSTKIQSIYIPSPSSANRALVDDIMIVEEYRLLLKFIK